MSLRRSNRHESKRSWLAEIPASFGCDMKTFGILPDRAIIEAKLASRMICVEDLRAGAIESWTDAGTPGKWRRYWKRCWIVVDADGNPWMTATLNRRGALALRDERDMCIRLDRVEAKEETES